MSKSKKVLFFHALSSCFSPWHHAEVHTATKTRHCPWATLVPQARCCPRLDYTVRYNNGKIKHLSLFEFVFLDQYNQWLWKSGKTWKLMFTFSWKRKLKKFEKILKNISENWKNEQWSADYQCIFKTWTFICIITSISVSLSPCSS